jgi:DNA-binding NarL/FixJ family response regulator
VSKSAISVTAPRSADATLDTKPALALIADEDSLDAIREALEEHDLAFTTFGSVEECSAALTEGFPALVAIRIDGAEGPLTQQIGALADLVEQADVVVICTDIERWEVRTALAGGIAGVVQEEEVARALGPCLQAVQAGQICVPRRHARQIEPPALSTREKQILGLVVMGYMNGQIAERLFLAESTDKSHLSSAFAKLGVRSRNEAVGLILDAKHGLGTGILALGGEPLQRSPTTQ